MLVLIKEFLWISYSDRQSSEDRGRASTNVSRNACSLVATTSCQDEMQKVLTYFRYRCHPHRLGRAANLGKRHSQTHTNPGIAPSIMKVIMVKMQEVIEMEALR